MDTNVLWANSVAKFASGDESGSRLPEDVADFRERLAALGEAVRGEAQLNNLGRAFAFGQLSRAITQRLQLGRLWREQPHLADIRLAPPIIVVGQMRSGTTRIHRLLAADPAHSGTRFCDAWNPVPPNRAWKPDLRPVKSALALLGARRLNPWLDTLHPVSPRGPDEELGWLASALDHSTYDTQWQVPSYTAFSEARCHAPIYRELRRILATNAARSGTAHLPRVMKVPQFSEDLPELLDQFPDARLVVAERRHDEVVRSAVSLVSNQMAMQSDNVDLDWLEREWERKVALREERSRRALANFDGPMVRLEFEALNGDWRAQLRRCYAALELPLSALAMAAMEREHSRSAHGAHRHHAASYKNFNKG
ncbi:sulfotransferase family protein [Alteripontixanthobacter maritimus]|uniref:sulfotransferase family protein n=1 Tax=Alteripontixanthobacter maritimus TaxID=2161824 RepID=UPI001E652DE4|nr:sulfotransferase [Alteripontixanthobacter maritimus]